MLHIKRLLSNKKKTQNSHTRQIPPEWNERERKRKKLVSYRRGEKSDDCTWERNRKHYVWWCSYVPNTVYITQRRSVASSCAWWLWLFQCYYHLVAFFCLLSRFCFQIEKNDSTTPRPPPAGLATIFLPKTFFFRCATTLFLHKTWYAIIWHIWSVNVYTMMEQTKKKKKVYNEKTQHHEFDFRTFCNAVFLYGPFRIQVFAVIWWKCVKMLGHDQYGQHWTTTYRANWWYTLYCYRDLGQQHL